MSDEQRKSIINKIKHLLRKKSSNHQGEVEAAMAKAQELANKYQIDLADVDPEAEEFEVEESVVYRSCRLQNEVKYAGWVVKEHFNVSTYILNAPGRYEYRIIGTGVDRELAQHVFDFLVESFRRTWSSALKSGQFHIQDRHVFMEGMYQGVMTRLREDKSKTVTERGLMVIGNKLAQRNRYAEKLGLKPGKPMHTNDGSSRAWAQGFEDGKKISIRPAVGGNTKNQPAYGLIN